MSIITTVYTERLTITTDDGGNVTMQRTSSADTHSAYLFDELSKEAQERAISDAIEEEQRDYYEYGTYGASQTGMSEAEIWDAAQELAKHQPVHIGTDAGGSPYGTARRYGWSTANWESVTEEQDTGICWSMDICDTWNAYAARIIVLQEGHEEAEDRAYFADTQEEQDAYNDIAERIEETAEELTEEAAHAVGNTVDGLIEAERDYYSSEEFWREWYSEGDERFTRDGERI